MWVTSRGYGRDYRLLGFANSTARGVGLGGALCKSLRERLRVASGWKGLWRSVGRASYI